MKYSVLFALLVGCASSPIRSPADLTALGAQDQEHFIAHGAGEAFRKCIEDADKGDLTEATDPVFITRERCNRDFDLIVTYLDRANQVIERWDEAGAQSRFRCLMRRVFEPLTDLRVAMGFSPPELESAIRKAAEVGAEAPDRCDP